MIHPIEYRYGSDEMRKIFSRDSWVRYAVEVEFALLKSLQAIGIIDQPLELIEDEKKKLLNLSYEDVAKYEKVTRHETMALVKLIYDRIDNRLGRFVHLGMTSNDVLDNVLMMQMRDGLKIIIGKLDSLIDVVKSFVNEHIDTPILGRTHGQAATPITLGFRFSIYLDELVRLRDEIELASDKYIVGKLGGSVGSQVELYPRGPELESIFLNNLRLDRASSYLQILPRDLIALIILRLITLSSVLEHLANEIRIMSREGVGEVYEYFEDRQVGSSIMPHKKNPITSEKICGIGRYLRSLAPSILENIVFEDERDLRNSSLERIVVPEVFLLVDEQLESLMKIFAGLRVDKERCKENIDGAGYRVYSSVLLHIGVFKGGDRQIIHDKLRKIFEKNYESVEDLYEALMKDEYLKKIYSYQDVIAATELNRYVDASRRKVLDLLSKLSE